MDKKCLRVIWIVFILSGYFVLPVGGEPISITVQADTGKVISGDLFGIFFEDLNYAADGGLYAELVQNRSFEYSAREQLAWNAFTCWEVVTRGGGRGSAAIDAAVPIHPNNPQYAVLEVGQTGDGVGLMNPGFDGIPVKAGEKYNFSVFARQLFMNNRWGGDSSIEGRSMPLEVRLESPDGQLLGEATLEVTGRPWKRYTATITADKTEKDGRLVVLAKARGGIAMDVISLFPQKTFGNRPNGLRADLAQAIADIKPRFVRFPGGCLAHGNGLGNMYRWKDTIGPVEQRREQANIWGYHQTAGLGYFEYFQFCEDIGAKPLPVVPAGVCCQNSDHTGGMGQRGLPMEEMGAYVQEVLDLIEWANGPADSQWGSKRAQAGHPQPFGLEYLGVGNEDTQTPVFRERFRMIYEAVKAKHPEITVIGTVGPFPDGEDYEAGWKFASEMGLAIVDEHCYRPPQWFWEHLDRFDAYDRSKSKVYLGEYAAHDSGRRTTLRSALAEAAYMTALERNSDVVVMASYAPLLAKRGRTQWNPDLIYFTNTEVFPTINYYVQQMFGNNAGDLYLPVAIEDSAKAGKLAVSAVKDSKSGDVIVKVVNGSDEARPLHIELAEMDHIPANADTTVLAGSDPMAVNDFDHPRTVVPETSAISVEPDFEYEVPPYSLTVLRIK